MEKKPQKIGQDRAFDDEHGGIISVEAFSQFPVDCAVGESGTPTGCQIHKNGLNTSLQNGGAEEVGAFAISRGLEDWCWSI